MARPTGRVVLLNGAPRAGKSSLVRAVQEHCAGVWVNLGVDVSMAATPAHLHPGIGLRPGGERADLEPVVQQLYGALFEAIAAYARAGLDVVSDLGLHDDYSRPLGIREDAMRRLAGLRVLRVGVLCPIETIMARRNADPQGGFYAAGATVPPPVARWQEAVHRGQVYDLTIDTSRLSPGAGAAAIAAALDRLGGADPEG